MGLTIEQIISYQTHGFLVADNLLLQEDIQPVIDEMNAEIERRARALYNEGKIDTLYEAEPFERRFALLQRLCPEIGYKMDIMDVLGPAMFQFLNNQRLLDAVECLLGSELSCNPIQHIRAKLPVKPDEEENLVDRVPWHQDAGVTLEESDASEIITFWIPLVDVSQQNGCLQIMPDVFKRGYMTHHVDGGTTIVQDMLPQVDPIFCECAKGSVVVMNKYTPHRSVANRSETIRWSLDLRYHKTGANSGRPSYPSFVVRSKSDPASVLDDHAQWSSLWKQALQTPLVKAHRV